MQTIVLTGLGLFLVLIFIFLLFKAMTGGVVSRIPNVSSEDKRDGAGGEGRLHEE